MVKSVASRCARGGESLSSLLAVVERRGSGDDEEESGEASGVDLVEKLPQGVEPLFPDVASDALQRFDLVEDEEQSGVAAVTQHGEEPLEEAECREVVEVPTDAGRTVRRGCDGLLSAQPGDERFGGGSVPSRDGPAVAAQRRGKSRRGAGDFRQPSFHQRVDRLGKPRLVFFVGLSGVEDFLLQGVEPRIDHGAQGTRLMCCGGQPLGQPAIDRLQPVQRSLRLGDLHFGRGQSRSLRAFGEPAGEEGLAGTVVSTNRVEGGPAPRGRRQVVVECRFEAAEVRSPACQPSRSSKYMWKCPPSTAEADSI